VGGEVWRTRGGMAICARRKSATTDEAASVRTSQSLSVADAGLLQPVEIAQEVYPLRNDAGLSGEIVEMFLHEQ
jgi:hypothetical protein